MIGNIPKKLIYFIRNQEQRSFCFDDSEIEINKLTVCPTFVSDSENKKTLETGKNWAAGHYSRANKYTTETRENTPLKNIKIVDLEIRSQGGRAYKVLIDDKYFVDLREDILLDLILTEGIEKGGKINGEYIWAKVKSQMKLIRVNSLLHAELLKATEFDKIDKLKGELEIGGIYANKKGEKFVYMGRVDTTRFIKDNNKEYRGYGYTEVFTDYKIEKLNNILCFCSFPDWADSFKGVLEKGYHLSFQKSHSFKEKIDNIRIPKDWIEITKTGIIKNEEEESKSYGSKNKFDRIDTIAYYSDKLNIGGIHPICQKMFDALNK